MFAQNKEKYRKLGEKRKNWNTGQPGGLSGCKQELTHCLTYGLISLTENYPHFKLHWPNGKSQLFHNAKTPNGKFVTSFAYTVLVC